MQTISGALQMGGGVGFRLVWKVVFWYTNVRVVVVWRGGRRLWFVADFDGRWDGLCERANEAPATICVTTALSCSDANACAISLT